MADWKESQTAKRRVGGQGNKLNKAYQKKIENSPHNI